MSAVIARFIAFLSGSVLAVFIALSVWDEDVLNVEHAVTVMAVLGGVVAVCRLFLPDENMVFCPERTLTAVIAHIHYFPMDDWKGRAHTPEVISHINELFPYTALTLVEELLSPIITPFVLLFMLRPRANSIVDFFRNFPIDNWKGRAHTYEVMSHLNELFPYTALTLVEELLSPIITPFVLLFLLRPRAHSIIDFF